MRSARRCVIIAHGFGPPGSAPVRAAPAAPPAVAGRGSGFSLGATLIPLWIGVPARRMAGLLRHPGLLARPADAALPFTDAEAINVIQTEAG